MSASRHDTRGPLDGAAIRAPRPRTGWLHALLLAGVAAVLAACGGSGQSGAAFVFLTVEMFSQDGTTPVAELRSSLEDRSTSTLTCVILRNNPKNPTVTAPTGLDNLLIQSYTVRIVRLDGGPEIPSFTIPTALSVPAGTVSSGTASGNTARLAVIVVPAQTKNQAPLSPVPPLPISATAVVTFKGRDGRGQSVQAEGAVGLVFVGEGPDATCAGGSGTTGDGTTPPVTP